MRWALVELVEAGVRTRHTQAAAGALEKLSSMARASGTEWALGIEAGRRALLHRGRAAEEHYREAIDRLAGTTVHVELARTQLLYGEWLRREGRRVDARAQLRTAHETLTAMGLQAFAERARHELLATGETVRKRSVDSWGELTSQEARTAGSSPKGSAIRRLALRCTSACGRWSGTAARSSPSSASALAGSCGSSCRTSRPCRPSGGGRPITTPAGRPSRPSWARMRRLGHGARVRPGNFTGAKHR
jgi:hypothetical protein